MSASDEMFTAALRDIVPLYSAPARNYKATAAVHMPTTGIVLPSGAIDIELSLTHTPSNLAVHRGFAWSKVEQVFLDSAASIVSWLDETFLEMYGELDEQVAKQKKQAGGHRRKESDPPDLIQHVIAYRGFKQAGHGRLAATGVSAVWEPGVNHAKCLGGSMTFLAPQHPSPAPAHICECGLYGLFRKEEAIGRGDGIWGAIKCWGTIEVHPEGQGIRAEFAEIVCLSGPNATKEIAKNYGVPLVHEALVWDEARKHGIEVPDEFKPDMGDHPHPPSSAPGGMVYMTSGAAPRTALTTRSPGFTALPYPPPPPRPPSSSKWWFRAPAVVMVPIAGYELVYAASGHPWYWIAFVIAVAAVALNILSAWQR